MKDKILISIRILLSIALLFGVYRETGIWTTLAILLLGISIEVFSRVLMILLERLNDGSL